LFEENSYPKGEEPEKAFGQEAFEKSTTTASEEMEEKREEGGLHELERPSVEAKVTEKSRPESSILEDRAQVLGDFSESPGKGETKGGSEERKVVSVKEEGIPSFPWIDHFRNAVETYHQKPRDIFSIWFKECQGKDEFRSPFHALLTILVHSRFDQGNESVSALENTRRVFRLIVSPSLPLEEIPLLEGTPFASGEVWRDLFHRALPKVQQIGNAVLGKNRWEVSDLERLVQVIPHVGDQNSRRAVQRIGELMTDVIEVDFSDMSVVIGEGLYRVASRLGIVNPDFDYCQGKNSTGDLKIQSFAKTAFPQNPLKVVEPMAGMGKEEEQGGHCFPVKPWCEGCLFETFCPKLHVLLNPSEKGMRE
jgi:hypothetical protein